MNYDDPLIAKVIIGLVIVAFCLIVFKVIRLFSRPRDSKKELIRQARIQREAIGRRMKK